MWEGRIGQPEEKFVNDGWMNRLKSGVNICLAYDKEYTEEYTEEHCLRLNLQQLSHKAFCKKFAWKAITREYIHVW